MDLLYVRSKIHREVPSMLSLSLKNGLSQANICVHSIFVPQVHRYVTMKGKKTILMPILKTQTSITHLLTIHEILWILPLRPTLSSSNHIISNHPVLTRGTFSDAQGYLIVMWESYYNGHVESQMMLLHLTQCLSKHVDALHAFFILICLCTCSRKKN